MTSATLLRRSPLHAWHAAHGARLGERAGWLVPLGYGEVPAEVAAARSGAGVADVSAFPKLSLYGRWPSAFARAATRPGTVARPASAPGTIACRVSDDHVLLTALAAEPALLEEAVEHLPPGVPLLREDAASAYAALWLCGPQSAAVLARLTLLDLGAAALPEGACVETGVAGVHAVVVRPPAVALPSTLLLVAPDVGEYVWERLLGCGLPVAPLGQDALAELLRS
jgi:glycine cleavage system aminomethyltransferase T